VALAVDLPNGIDIGDKLIAIGERMNQFQLKVLVGMRDSDAIGLSEQVKQVNSLMDQLVPGFPSAIFERCITVGSPFLKQCGGTVFLAEIS
jgi:hypothetical protein